MRDEPRSEGASGAECLSVRGLRVEFPGVVALDGVDFRARSGEVHALMGENGAGKSTLVRCVTGVLRASAGEIRLGGRVVSPASAREAERLGISTVHQDVALIPGLSIAENLSLGREPTRWGLVRVRAERARARAALARLDLDLDVRRTLGSMPIGARQLVAIARALDLSARVLILDEPTSSLDRSEAERLLGVIRSLRARGLAIVLVSHVLDQVYAVADRITILRDGRLVGEHAARDLGRLRLVSLMLGREIGEGASRGPEAGSGVRGPSVLAAKGLGRRRSVEGIGFDLARGECLGLAGLMGSGRTETARLLFGVDRADRGEIRVDGKRVRLRSPRDGVRAGIALTPEDRKGDGIIGWMSIEENIALALQARLGWWRRIGRARRRALAASLAARLGVRGGGSAGARDASGRSAGGLGTRAGALSGGNQQKVLLARWIATRPSVLILDEPTRGIDVGAKQEIERLVRALRAGGGGEGSPGEGAMGVVFISSELDEVARVAERVLVLRDRRCVATLERPAPGAIMEAIARHA